MFRRYRNLLGLETLERRELLYANLIVDVSGAMGSTDRGYHGGKAGEVVIESGANIDTGDASGLNGRIDLLRSETPTAVHRLHSDIYNFRQVGTASLPAFIEVSGEVKIYTQYGFNAIVVRAPDVPAPSLTIHAGSPVFVNSYGADAIEAWHQVHVNLSPVGNGDRSGGHFTFKTTDSSSFNLASLPGEDTRDIGLVAMVSAVGGAGALGDSGQHSGNGGNGGNVKIRANETNISFSGSVSGGDVGAGLRSANGGQGGDAGTIAVKVHNPIERRHGGKSQVFLGGSGGISLNGGIGGDGTHGLEGQNGLRGGDGGNAGSLRVDADEVLAWVVDPFIEAIGGSGGRGGRGGSGTDGVNGSPGGNGGDGGNGGKGGQGGNVSQNVTAFQPVIETGDGGRGGVGGSGGTGTPVGRAGNAGADGGDGVDFVSLPNELEALKSDQWTIMVYIAADDYLGGNDPLEKIWVGILNTLEQVKLSDTQVNLVVFMDRAPMESEARIPSDDASDHWANWQDSRVGFVAFDPQLGERTRPHFNTVLVPIDPSVPEKDTGEPTVLVDFVNWSVDRAPAEHYGLVLMGHGGVWTNVLPDDSSGNTLLMSELRSAFNSLPKIDVLALDACNMQAAEVATELTGEVDYVVGSEHAISHTSQGFTTRFEKTKQWCGAELVSTGHETTTADAFQFREWIGQLKEQPDQSPQETARRLTELAAPLTRSISYVDLSDGGARMDALIAALDAFGGIVAHNVDLSSSSQWTKLDEARLENVISHPWLVDLGRYMDSVQELFETSQDPLSQQIALQAENVLRAVLELVPAEGLESDGELGLSITVPPLGVRLNPGIYNQTNLHFLERAKEWHKFVTKIGNVTSEPGASTPKTKLHMPTRDIGDSSATSLLLDIQALDLAIVESELDGINDVDAIQVAASADEIMAIDLRGAFAPSPNANSYMLTVLDPRGSVVGEYQTEISSSSAPQIAVSDLVLPTSGTYTLIVSGNQDARSHYTLQVRRGQSHDLVPRVHVETSVVDFGTVARDVIAEAAISIENRGGLPLEIRSLTLPADSRSVVPAASLLLNVPPFSSVDLPVLIVPDEQGILSEVLTIETNDPAQPELFVDITADVVISEGPIASNDSFFAGEGGVIEMPVLDNDSSTTWEIDVASLQLSSLAAHGTVTPDPFSGQIHYDADLGYLGTDTFTYVVSDSTGYFSNPATVSITLDVRPFPWQNPKHPLNVNYDTDDRGNAVVSPLDALLVINELTTRSHSDVVTGLLAAPPAPPNLPEAYFDVTGDGVVSPLDALQVINGLNESASAVSDYVQAEALRSFVQVKENLVLPVMQSVSPARPATMAATSEREEWRDLTPRTASNRHIPFTERIWEAHSSEITCSRFWLPEHVPLPAAGPEIRDDIFSSWHEETIGSFEGWRNAL